MGDNTKVYPECEKLLAVKDKSQTLGEFLEWLTGKGFVLAKYPEDEEDDAPNRLRSFNYGTEKLLAEFFEIDLNKVEAERREILASLQT